MDFSMIGPALALGLACIGSAIGCGIAGMTSHAVMSRVEENHAKFISLSAAPSTQSILGLVLMVMMRNQLEAGTLSPLAALGIGGAIGLAFLICAIYQGMCGASAIQATAKQPAVFGKCFAVLGIIESFAIFAFVFALLLIL